MSNLIVDGPRSRAARKHRKEFLRAARATRQQRAPIQRDTHFFRFHFDYILPTSCHSTKHTKNIFHLFILIIIIIIAQLSVSLALSPYTRFHCYFFRLATSGFHLWAWNNKIAAEWNFRHFAKNGFSNHVSIKCFPSSVRCCPAALFLRANCDERLKSVSRSPRLFESEKNSQSAM